MAFALPLIRQLDSDCARANARGSWHRVLGLHFEARMRSAVSVAADKRTSESVGGGGKKAGDRKMTTSDKRRTGMWQVPRGLTTPDSAAPLPSPLVRNLHFGDEEKRGDGRGNLA